MKTVVGCPWLTSPYCSHHHIHSPFLSWLWLLRHAAIGHTERENIKPLYRYLSTSFSSHVVHIKSSVFQRNHRISGLELQPAVTKETRKYQNKSDRFNKQNQTIHMWTTLFGGFLCHHRTTNVVKLDRNGNAIVAFIGSISSRLRFYLKYRQSGSISGPVANIITVKPVLSGHPLGML